MRWVAGQDDGLLVALRDDGAAWSKQTIDGAWCTLSSNSYPSIQRGVWGSSKDDVWFTGGHDGPTLFRNRKGTWTQRAATLREEDLHAVWGSAADDVWAVGGGYLGATEGPHQGLALHFDGAAWTSSPLPVDGGPTRELSCVYGSGPRDVWAGGWVDPDILHWDGAAWSLAHHDSVSGSLLGIWTDGREVFAVGAATVVRRPKP